MIEIWSSTCAAWMSENALKKLWQGLCVVMVLLMWGVVPLHAAQAPADPQKQEQASKPDAAAPATAQPTAAAPAVEDLTAEGDDADAAAEQQSIEDKMRQEAAAAGERLRTEAENAQKSAKSSTQDDALWNEAFKQNQAEIKAIEIEVDTLRTSLRGIVRPLRDSLTSVGESSRSLFALATSHGSNPRMLETIQRRGLLLASSLRQQIQPVQSARNVVDELTSSLEQVRRALPEDTEADAAAGPRPVQARDELLQVQEKLERMDRRLARTLTPATALLGLLDKMDADINAALPMLWQDFYMQLPSRFFDLVAWQNIRELWSKAWQNMALRLSVEIPRSAFAWQGVGLRFLNVLLMGLVVLYFVRRRLVRHVNAGQEPMAAPLRQGILRSLLWFFCGLGFIVAAFGSKGELFRGIMTVGSLLCIWGEMELAWHMRGLSLEQITRVTPLWPLLVFSGLGIALDYPEMPGVALSLLWIVCGLSALWFMRKMDTTVTPPLEARLLALHRLAMWLSLGTAAIGWPRMAIMLLVLIDCLLISTQLILGTMQVINRTADVHEDEQQVERSILAGLMAACSAPTVLIMVLFSMALWVLPLPGGLPLLWHYLGAGVNVGSASFNIVHLFLIISLFYLTRAAITAAQNLLERLAERSRRLDKSLIPPMQTGVTYGLWTLFGLFTLQALGFGLENLAVVAGGLSVGIGFGLQAIVNNFLSGLILIFSRTLHEGDIIDVGGLQGMVRKISVRATTVETFDNAVIFVPNSEFVANNLINWTRNGRSVRREVSVGVAYGTDPQLVERLLLEIAMAHTHVLRKPQPLVLFMDFSSSTLNFTVRYWADIALALTVASDIRHQIARVFAENQVEIAFPQLDVHMVGPAFSPRMKPHGRADVAEKV